MSLFFSGGNVLELRLNLYIYLPFLPVVPSFPFTNAIGSAIAITVNMRRIINATTHTKM